MGDGGGLGKWYETVAGAEMGCVLTFEKAMSFVPDSNTTAPPKEKAKAAEIAVCTGRTRTATGIPKPHLNPTNAHGATARMGIGLTTVRTEMRLARSARVVVNVEVMEGVMVVEAVVVGGLLGK